MRPRLALAGILLAASSCGGSDEAAAAGSAKPATEPAGPLVVYTVNRPLASFAERIGGDRVRVHFSAPADVDPAFWNPTREVVAEYQTADVVLLNGAGYARWVERASLPLGALVDTSRAIADRLVVTPGTTTHRHGPEGEHSHGEVAFTTWLDPELAIEQARAIAAAFARERPEDEHTFLAGLAALESDLRDLDRELSAAFTPPPRLIASHPVYQYLEQAYDLDLRSLHWEPGAVPDEAAWSELESLLSEHPARVLLWEAEPLPEVRERLAHLGLESAVFDPRGNGQGDVVAGWRSDAVQLGRLLAGE